MKKDWHEVCDALGTPKITTAQDYSTTKRRRAYWHNFDIPETWADELAPVDPDTCMNPGRKVIRYRAGGRLCVRPITSSWTGSPDDPRAASNKKLMVNDEEFDSPQDILPEEAEKLHGIPEGRTSGEGISAKQRLKCIGGGWDLRICFYLFDNLFFGSVSD